MKGTILAEGSIECAHMDYASGLLSCDRFVRRIAVAVGWSSSRGSLAAPSGMTASSLDWTMFLLTIRRPNVCSARPHAKAERVVASCPL